MIIKTDKTPGRVIFTILYMLATCLLASCSPNSGEQANASVSSEDSKYPMAFSDDGARAVLIKHKPQTIISLAPSVSDMVTALGKADMLRGVTIWCDNPALSKVERIGNLTTPDIERIIAIRPDLVLGTEMTPLHIYDTLEAAGIPCLMFKHQGLDDVMYDMLRMADAMGEHDTGAKVVAEMQKRRNSILAGIPAGAPVKVALIYDFDSMGSAGRGSWVDDMLKSISLDNIANRAQSSWPRLSKEALITEQPFYIIVPLPSDAAEAAALRKRIADMKNDSMWSRVDAIRNDRLIFIPANHLNIPGPRTLDAMQFLSEAAFAN